jgi:large conductance mechanosensitive channel protein
VECEPGEAVVTAPAPGSIGWLDLTVEDAPRLRDFYSAVVGWKPMRYFWMPLLLLFLVVPLPNFIQVKVSAGMQLISSAIGVWFLRLMDISVFLEGNVIDLAVGVVIGGAFGKIVGSMVDDLLTPAILTPALKAANLTNLADLKIEGTAIKYGSFLSSTISFIIIAFALFMVIIAAFIGTQDLGQEMQRALSTTDVGKGLVLGFAVASMGLMTDHLITRWSELRKRALGL